MVACPRCGDTFPLVQHMIAHLGQIHSNEAHFRVVCNLQKSRGTCYSVFHSFASYKTHMYRYHSGYLSADTGESHPIVTEIMCCVCKTSHPSLQALKSHYREHCNEGLSVPCVVKRCNRVFTVLSSYTAHMSRCHRNVSLLNIRDDVKCHKAASLSTPVNEMSTMDTDDLSAFSHSTELTEADTTKNIALLFLKMKAQYCLSDTTIQAIVDDFSNLFYVNSLIVKERVGSLCTTYSLPHNAVVEFCDAADSGCWKEAMSELNSDFRRTAYYKRSFPYVPPNEYKFSDDCNNDDSFQYISVIETLKVVLKNDDILAQILNPEACADGHLQSFRDGTLYKNHPIFSQTDCGIQIVVYSDEFEIVNPLGPHKKKHKIMAFYFTLGNFHNTCKSQKSSMFLLALCRSVDIQKYGFSKIAMHFNEEMQVLETSGITVDGHPHKMRGALTFIAGDNLNSHMIGDFNACFSPNVLYPCRFCLTTNSELQEIVSVDEMCLRTLQSYDQHASVLATNPGQLSCFGIRFTSSFISGSFLVIDGLPPDIMHDLLEGVVPFEMSLILKYCISKGYFTLEELNSILASWKYGPLDKENKPVPISPTFVDAIKQNAGRMWCLLRLFPLMVAHKIPVGDKYWQFFLQLKDIVELVFAPRLAVGHILMLQTKVQDHLHLYCELFPDKLLKPKQHYMLHYANCMFMFGPLRTCWCMRFESKHYYFARLMRVVNNYKHACKTLAERHQMSLAYLLASNSMFVQHDFSVSATVDVDVNFLSESVVEALQHTNISMSQKLHQCRFVKLNGIMYHCNMYVVVDVVDDTPVFGQIIAIFVQNINAFFLLQICKSDYDPHLSGYIIEVTNDVEVHTVKQLIDYYPLSGYIVGLDRVVVLKNFVYSQSQFDC